MPRAIVEPFEAPPAPPVAAPAPALPVGVDPACAAGLLAGEEPEPPLPLASAVDGHEVVVVVVEEDAAPLGLVVVVLPAGLVVLVVVVDAHGLPMEPSAWVPVLPAAALVPMPEPSTMGLWAAVAIA